MEAIEWSAAAKAGDPVFVVFCADDNVNSSTGNSAQEGWSFDLLKQTAWMLSNGAFFVTHCLDAVTANVDPDFPQNANS